MIVLFLVQGDEGPAQVVRLGHQGTPSVSHSDDGAISSSPAPYHLAAEEAGFEPSVPGDGEISWALSHSMSGGV